MKAPENEYTFVHLLSALIHLMIIFFYLAGYGSQLRLEKKNGIGCSDRTTKLIENDRERPNHIMQFTISEVDRKCEVRRNQVDLLRLLLSNNLPEFSS